MVMCAGIVPARSAAPMVKTQAPGYYRMMLGAFEVTALYDGAVDIDMKFLRGAPEEEIKRLLSRMFVNSPKVPTSVNAYLINTGSKLLLIDSGYGKMSGPNVGKLSGNLKASGYSPEQVDAVLITHIHVDHVGGLIDGAGRPAFPNAVVYAPKREDDFWLSPAEEGKAPPHLKRYFKIAHDISRPYIDLDRWKTFGAGDLPFPGFKALSTPGHTPGQHAFEVKSEGESMLIMGDVVHSMAVQFPRPDISIRFDTDQKAAISARQDLFKRISESGSLVAVPHMPFPGIGRIRADGPNAYTWAPVEYSPCCP